MALNSGWAYTERIKARHAGWSLIACLAASHRHSSRQEWGDRILRGEVEIDGRRAEPGTAVREGQALVWRRPPWDEPDVPMHYDVLHEDAAIVAVIKPSGLPTMTAGGFLEHTLHALVKQRYAGASPLHRLGRFTSGIVLFARTSASASILSKAWREHEVTKQYRALCIGVASQDVYEITMPIGLVPHPRLGTIHGALKHGRPSHTVASVIERRTNTTLFSVVITTGRPHQIRIHMACAGHPLVGDPVFGIGGVPRDQPGLPGDGGFLLHAERLRFTHPLTKATIELEAPPPESLRRQVAIR